ncbi:MAG: FHA domain-containing protein [Azovibrio sp.]|uniref:FHA domain-containing protein n=1 Tax=Azovibrio sp. TaxID=1872673 RepID=UPI003C717AFD
MAKLILSMDGLVLKEINLEKERITIGRKPHNDIQIDNLAISGVHAAVVTILNDSFLEDLDSTNGTLVNGQPVKKHFLRHNDVIELGKYKLKYLNDTPVAAQGSDYEKTMIIRPATFKPVAPDAVPAQGDHSLGSQTLAPGGEGAQPTPAAALPGAVIQILNGANAGKELPLVKTLTSLGKPGVQVAVIARRPQGYFITHVEGAHFPVVNGHTLDAQAHPLKDHDVIEISGVKMEFFLKS